MDWIEQLFHISPDGGNGATELSFMLVLVILCVLVVLSLWARRRAR
jgi:hypothetical protein